jgi:hypothetical protein
MAINHNAFPQRLQLWYGVILGTIAHAIWLASSPEFSHEQSWDGLNYSIQDSMGSRGTVSFAGDQVVGVFFDKDSPRNPLRLGKPYDVRPFLRGMPPSLLALAEGEALQYVLQEYDGTIMPIITAAFWSEGEYLAAAEPWVQVFDHGAHLIHTQIQDYETAISEWQAEYEMPSAQVDLMKSLFNRKIASSQKQILLSDSELDALIISGDEGLDESRELLATVGIIVP